jgi:hypothetical protein
MAANLALVLLDAVRRKQLFQLQHPDIVIELHYAPAWHWAATLPDGRVIVDYDLSGLLDELSGQVIGTHGRRP